MPGAQNDLYELKAYMLTHWGAKAWEKAESEIFDSFALVDSKPNFGKPVPELTTLGIDEFPQTITSHHKIIYQPNIDKTLIHIVANFAQDFQTKLRRRILRVRYVRYN